MEGGDFDDWGVAFEGLPLDARLSPLSDCINEMTKLLCCLWTLEIPIMDPLRLWAEFASIPMSRTQLTRRGSRIASR